MKTPSSSPSRGTASDEGRDQLRAFLAEENTGELDGASFDKVNAILAQALEWNRKDLMAAAEEMMADDLSTARRAYLFGGLLNLLSTKDQTGALTLYDRAWEAAGFNRNGKFHVYEMVMNLADHDPQQAAEWVKNRRDHLPEEATDVLLEKIRGKAAR